MVSRVPKVRYADLDSLTREAVCKCLSKCIEIKRDCIIDLDTRSTGFKQIKESIGVDLRKWHDLGPHLCSKTVASTASTERVEIDFSRLINSHNSKRIFGDHNLLQLEHVLPVKMIVETILCTSRGTPLRDLIEISSWTAWIFSREDEQIQEISDRANPQLSYQNAGISLLKRENDAWIEFDWREIEHAVRTIDNLKHGRLS
jgi:hypothetical protein